MENKKYTELELYLLLRFQAQLVEQTRHAVLDNTFKHGKSDRKDLSIFSLLGVLLDLQKLNIFIDYPHTEAKDKIQFEDLVSFIAKNHKDLEHSNKTINSTTNRTVLNWLLLHNHAFENRFADFIDYVLNDLHINLVLPKPVNKQLKEKLKSDDDSLMLSLDAKLKKQRKELDLMLGK